MVDTRTGELTASVLVGDRDPRDVAVDPTTHTADVRTRADRGTVAVVTSTFTGATADGWPAQVRGFTAPGGRGQGVLPGRGRRGLEAGGDQADPDQDDVHRVTIDRRAFTRVSRIRKEGRDDLQVKDRKITFSFRNFGELDGLSFTTPTEATRVTSRLEVAGKPALARQVLTGRQRTVSPVGNPVSYQRLTGERGR